MDIPTKRKVFFKGCRFYNLTFYRSNHSHPLIKLEKKTKRKYGHLNCFVRFCWKWTKILQLHNIFPILILYIYIYICVFNGNCDRTNTFNTNVLTDPLIETPSETRNKLHVTSLLVQNDVANKCNVLKSLYLHQSKEKLSKVCFVCGQCELRTVQLCVDSMNCDGNVVFGK
jgi:hypothetical protein